MPVTITSPQHKVIGLRIVRRALDNAILRAFSDAHPAQRGHGYFAFSGGKPLPETFKASASSMPNWPDGKPFKG